MRSRIQTSLSPAFPDWVASCSSIGLNPKSIVIELARSRRATREPPLSGRLRRARPCGLCRIQTTILNGKRTLIMDILDNSERNSRFLELRRYASETLRSLNQEWLKKKPDRARVRTL